MALQSRTQTRDGVRLHYLHHPGGPPAFVMLHGNSHCGGVWAPLAESLASSGHETLALDLRGHGLSDKPETDYAWETLRDDALSIVDLHGLRDVLFVGHSRGGGVSLLAGAALGQRARGVVVYEPTVPMVLALPPDQRTGPPPNLRLTERALRRRTAFDSRRHLYEHYRTRDAFKDWREDYLWAFIEHGTLLREDGSVELLCPPWVEASLYEAMVHVGPWARIHSPDLPVLVVFGDRGGRVREGRDPVAYLRPLFARVEAEVMAGSTHFGPMEHPEEFERIVRQRAGVA